MKKDNRSAVLLLFGGRGFEHSVSVEGAKFLFPKIDTEKNLPIPVYINRLGEWLTVRDPIGYSRRHKDNSLPDTSKFNTRVYPYPRKGGIGGAITVGKRELPIALAIPLLHGDHGEDGEIQGALETALIPYVGSDVSAGALSADKAYTKIIAEYLGIPTAPFRLAIADGVIFDNEELLFECEESFGYPMFVKPARLGSSVGAASVNCRDELRGAIASIISLGQSRILIEKQIKLSRELECAYLALDGDLLISEPGEIRVDGGFYDYETKYLSDTASVREVSELPPEKAERLRAYTERLAEYLGIRELSRFDFFEDADGNIIFNEVNTFPGFTESSLYPRLVRLMGISARELVNRLISERTEQGK